MVLKIKGFNLEALPTGSAALSPLAGAGSKPVHEHFSTDSKAALEGLLEQVLSQEQGRIDLAKAVFLWVLLAFEDITIDTLRHAIATCHDNHTYEAKRLVSEHFLISICCGLVVLDETTRLVRLIHFTAKDILVQHVFSSSPQPHATLVSVCIKHLTDRGFQCSALENLDDLNDAMGQDPLLAYAYHSWVKHAQKGFLEESDIDPISDFVMGCTKYPTQLSNRDGLDFLGPLHVASLYDLEHLIYPETQLQPPSSRTLVERALPLGLACRWGNHDCVNALLSLENINVNLRGGAEDLTPLMEAARAGHVDIVRHLLEMPRIDIEAKAAGKQTSLLLASKGGHGTIVELLLGATGTGASVTAVDSDDYTLLAHALAGGHEDIARRILDFLD